METTISSLLSQTQAIIR